MLGCSVVLVVCAGPAFVCVYPARLFDNCIDVGTTREFLFVDPVSFNADD